MRYNTYYERTAYAFGGGLTSAIKYLVLVCTGVFLVSSLFGFADRPFWLSTFGLTPYRVNHDFFIWQFATYIFIHGGLWHLLFNMFALWMFGTELERTWGTREFLFFFFVSGVGAGVFHWIFSSGLPLPLISGNPHQSLIGASGAVFGVLAAYGMMFPERKVLFLLIFPMRARNFVLLIAAIELYFCWSYTPGGVGHLAHLSGMLVGYIYLKKEFYRISLAGWYENSRRRRRIKLVRDQESHREREQEEVDRILDKINARGLESLSRSELKILERASGRAAKQS